ncbi:MAG: c-type cytochrome [Rhodocyclaceae bacterium]|nr:c-type cytochrome [Rhodocyclaceae bacterium]
MKRTMLAVIVTLFASATALAADPINGKQIYEMHCAVCHGVGGHPVLPSAPSFAKGERMMQPDTMLIESIENGKNVMPGFLGLLRTQEIRDVIAYLRTLHR